MASAYRSEHCIAIFAITILCWPWPYLGPHFFDWRELHQFHGIGIQVWTLHCNLCHHNTLLTLTLPLATFLWLKRAASVSWHRHTGLNTALQSLPSQYFADLDLTLGHISLIEESCISFIASAYRSEHCIAIFAIALLCWPWPYLGPHFFDWRELHQFHRIGIQVWTLHCNLCHHHLLHTIWNTHVHCTSQTCVTVTIINSNWYIVKVKICTVKHLFFARPYFRENAALDIFTRLYFRDYPYLVL